MNESLVERYLRLGLRIGRHVDGIVDSYFGPPELLASVDAEPLLDPQALVAAAEGLLEETLVLAPTPQSLVSEGIATLAPTVLLEGDGGAALAAVVHGAGIDFDHAHALAVQEALQPWRWAEVNAALMLHHRGASEAEVRAYLERWGLLSPELAAHMIRFFSEPASRTYVITYSAGQDLCRAYVGDAPERFRHLLSAQLRVRDLLEAASPSRGHPSARGATSST